MDATTKSIATAATTEVIEVLGVPSTATNDEKAGGSYVVGGYGAIEVTFRIEVHQIANYY
jgi:hypothetical protein